MKYFLITVCMDTYRFSVIFSYYPVCRNIGFMPTSLLITSLYIMRFNVSPATTVLLASRSLSQRALLFLYISYVCEVKKHVRVRLITFAFIKDSENNCHKQSILKDDGSRASTMSLASRSRSQWTLGDFE